MSKKEVKEPIVMPVCPFCKAKMTPLYFKGYYESFSMWECECLEIPGAGEERGAYA